MTDSSTSTPQDGVSGAESTADPSPVSVVAPIASTARSIPVSVLTGREHDGVVDLDDAIDDPTLPYRAQIVAVVALIDDALPGTATRTIVPSDEMRDLLLDMRLLLA